jgi:hypothetical protein
LVGVAVPLSVVESQVYISFVVFPFLCAARLAVEVIVLVDLLVVLSPLRGSPGTRVPEFLADLGLPVVWGPRFAGF